MIDINALIVLLRMLKFHCSYLDTYELRTWLFNHQCFAEGPNIQEKHVMLIYRDQLVRALKEMHEA